MSVPQDREGSGAQRFCTWIVSLLTLAVLITPLLTGEAARPPRRREDPMTRDHIAPRLR